MLYLFLEHAYELLCKAEIAIYTPTTKSPIKQWSLFTENTMDQENCAVQKQKSALALIPAPEMSQTADLNQVPKHSWLGLVFFPFLLLNGKSVLRLHRKCTCYVEKGHLQ